jgi:predicted nucleic acid-binding protein
LIVADTNLIAYSLIAGPLTADADRVLEADEEWLAAPLWRSEFLNVLWMSVRRGVITHPEAEAAYGEAELLVRTVERPDHRQVLGLALASGCTAYDCEFVALATAERLPLVTADSKVLAAFPSVAVSIRSFP